MAATVLSSKELVEFFDTRSTRLFSRSRSVSLLSITRCRLGSEATAVGERCGLIIEVPERRLKYVYIQGICHVVAKHFHPELNPRNPLTEWWGLDSIAAGQDADLDNIAGR
jgi:hypothetical protein